MAESYLGRAIAAMNEPPGAFTRLTATEYRMNLLARKHHLRLEKIGIAWTAYDSQTEQIVATGLELATCKADCLEYLREKTDAMRSNLIAQIKALDPAFNLRDFGLDSSVAELKAHLETLAQPSQLTLL